MVMCCFLDQCVWDLFHGTGTIYVCAVLCVQYLGAVLVSVFLRPVRGCYFFYFFCTNDCVLLLLISPKNNTIIGSKN